VSGVSGCGKTEFILRMIRNVDHLISPEIEKIHWIYGAFQPKVEELKSSNFTTSSSLESSLKELEYNTRPMLLIIDDFMHCAGSNSNVAELFTKGSHHRNISVMFVVQNLFHKGSLMRDIHLNAHYLVLFNSPRDRAQIQYLSRSIFPGNTKYFMEAFADATKQEFGYLLVDLKPGTPEDRRLKSRIFPDEQLWVYVPRNTI
jgi:hypothetical protein